MIGAGDANLRRVDDLPTFVFFRVDSPDHAHGLQCRLEPICRVWAELQPKGEWIVGVDVAHGEHLSLAGRAAAGWAADSGLKGLPLEYEDELFFVPAAASLAQSVGPATETDRRPPARSRSPRSPFPPVPEHRRASSCRPERPFGPRRPWR